MNPISTAPRSGAIVLALLAASMAAIMAPHVTAQEPECTWQCPEAKEAAKAGAQVGEQLLQRAREAVPTYSEEGGRSGEGVLHISGAGDVPLGDVVPGADPAKAQAIGTVIQDERTREEAIAASQEETAKDSSVAAQAYRTGRNSDTSQARQLANDSELWRQTDSTLGNIEAWNEDLANCTTTTLYKEDMEWGGGYLREQATCEAINIPDQATVSRDLEARQDQATLLEFDGPIIQERTLVIDAGTGAEEGEVVAAADVQLQWSGDVQGVAITELPSAYNRWKGELTVTPHASAPPGGEQVTIKVTAERTLLKDIISAAPEAPLMGSDAFCTARWTCEDSMPRVIGGILVDDAVAWGLPPLYPPNQMNDPPSASQPFCWQASATYECPFNLGTLGCWTTPSGEQRCHTSTPENVVTNTCDTLNHRQECGHKSVRCNDQARGFGDFCYVETHTYECRTSIDIPEVRQTKRTECTGALACIGDNCVERKEETIQGRARAQAALSVVQHMLSDRKLSEGRPTVVHHPGEPGNEVAAAAAAAGAPATVPEGEVEWFPGEAYECRKATGSTLDCCNLTEGDGNHIWQDIYQRHTRRSNAPRVAAALRDIGVPEEGSWHDLDRAETWNYTDLKRPLFSKIEEISAGGPMPEVEDNSLSPVLAKYQTQRAQEQDPGWECTSAERTLGAMREAGMCESVGSYCQPNASGACVESRNVYCCYSSPLSRQLVVNALGGPEAVAQGALGTPTLPSCGGVGQAVIERINPSQVDPAEWKGRRQDGRFYARPQDMQARYSQEALTGDGSALATPGVHRPTIGERIGTRLKGAQLAKAAHAMDTDARTRTLPPQGEPTTAGEISLAPTFQAIKPGQIAIVPVRRTGGAGAVSVSYTTLDDSAIAPTDYEAASGTLTWAAGETGEQTFRVHTQPRQGGGRRTIALRLSDPTGGAVLGAASGEIRLAAGGSAPPPPAGPEPQIRVEQYLASFYPSLDKRYLTYRVVMTNTGAERVHMPRLRLRAARGDAFHPTHPGNADPRTLACWQATAAGNPVACAPDVALNIGESMTLSVSLIVDATGPLETWCSGDATGVTSGRIASVQEEQCRSSTDATLPDIDSGEWAGCSPHGFGWEQRIDSFESQFPGQRPPSSGGQSAFVQSGPAHIHSTAFRAPNMIGKKGLILALPTTPQGDGTPIYANISRCPGTLSPPYPHDETHLDPACTNLVPTGTWPVTFTATSSIVFETHAGASGEPTANNFCGLRPGEQYYLTISAVDLTNYWAEGVWKNPSCKEGECEAWHRWLTFGEEPADVPPELLMRPTPAPAPTADPPKKALRGDVPEGCPAPLNGFARAPGYSSFEQTFMDGRGRLREHGSTVGVNRQQYAAIPFYAPSDGGILHRLDWDAGTGTGALVTISRCPGDAGLRSAADAAPELSEGCIGTPGGEPRKKGTLIFQGGGAGPAEKTCRLFPGTPYYINVFRLGIPEASEATSRCAKAGVLNCGPRITVDKDPK